jgi:transcriptional regulator with XRE-family HTH domain
MKQNGLGMSSTKLAHHFNLRYWGRSITVGAANNWINGKSLPQLDKLVVLAKILNTTVDELVRSCADRGRAPSSRCSAPHGRRQRHG